MNLNNSTILRNSPNSNEKVIFDLKGLIDGLSGTNPNGSGTSLSCTNGSATSVTIINHVPFKSSIKKKLELQLLNFFQRYYHQQALTQREINKKTPLKLGFSLLEVLISILAVSGFLLLSLEATVLATLLRVQAQDKQQTANWVQQDLELIRYRAFELDKDTGDADGDGDTEEYLTQIDSPDTSNCDIYGSHLKNNLDGTTAGNFLTNDTITIDDKSYDVTRNYILTDQDTSTSGVQTNILQVSYIIEYASTHPRYKGASADNQVTSLSTEVIPHAVLSCP